MGRGTDLENQMSLADFMYVDAIPDKNLERTLDLLKKLCAKGCHNEPQDCATYDFYGANRVHYCVKKSKGLG